MTRFAQARAGKIPHQICRQTLGKRGEREEVAASLLEVAPVRFMLRRARTRCALGSMVL